METLLFILQILAWLLGIGLAALLVCWVMEYKVSAR
jgi:hypothetical protein